MPDLKEGFTGGAGRKRWRAPKVPSGTRSVGVIEPSYGMERVSYALRSPAFSHSVARVLPLRHLDRRTNFYTMTPVVLARGYDLIHAWNSTPRNGRFVTTIEMEFPRLFGDVSERQVGYVLGRVASHDCRGLWPLSDAAKRYVERRFTRLGRPELSRKLDVFRGAITERPSPPRFERAGGDARPVRLIFVGEDGLRKGLYPLVSAVNEVVRAGGNLHLTIVGSFTSESYTTPGVTFDRPGIEEAARSASWITVHDKLPNHEVRALMDSHDVLAFPTFDESLGWVPMEAAMSGLPTISTDIFALPEFVIDGETGWTAPVPLNDDLRWRSIGVGGEAGREAFLETEGSIKADLLRILGKILDAPDRITEFGQAAHALAQDRYRPEVAARRLETLYDEAMA